MFIKQLSVFIENKAGRLSEILNVLSENHIDISAMSIAETTEFGVLRMIVNDPDTAKTKLRESGVIVKTTNVLGLVLDDKPGALADIITMLSQKGVVIEYSYAFLSSNNKGALIVLRTDDQEHTEKLLTEAGIGLLDPKEVYRI